MFDIEYLEYKLLVVEKIIETYEKFAVYQPLDLLNELDFSFDKSKDHEIQIKKIKNKIKGLRNKIKIDKSNFVELNKARNKDIKINLDKQASQLEVSLNLGYQIETRTISVSKWISLTDINNEKIINYGKLK